MRVIGVSGKAGSGKDTVADMLVFMDKSGHTFKASFAAPMKDMCREMGWNGEKDTNGRVLLQYVGTRERRDSPNYWVNLLRAQLEQQELKLPFEPTFVITDTRFTNEADAIRAWGGAVWRVERPGAGLKGKAALHPSETDLDSYDGFALTIVNDGSKEDLESAVQAALEAE